jgi:hypothetical protein
VPSVPIRNGNDARRTTNKEALMHVNCGLFLLAMFLAVAAAGAEDAKAQKRPKRDPKVLELVKQAADLYKNAKSLHVEVDVETNVQNGAEKQEIRISCSYDLEPPNRFALRARNAKDKATGTDFISDGKQLLVHSLTLKQYTESAAPASLADLGPKVAGLRRSNTGFFMPNLMTEDPYESLMDDVITCTYAGKEKIGDVESHHVKVVHPEIKWELWIAAAGKPLVQKATTLVAVDEIRVSATEIYRTWKVNEPLDKAAFAVTVPADATKVDAIGQPKKSK